MAYPLRVLLQLSASHFLWERHLYALWVRFERQHHATASNRPEGGGAWLLLL